jgi:hypothetical protein
MAYEITVDFDDADTDVVAKEVYFSVLAKYGGGAGTGHSDGTSSMIVSDLSILNTVRELKRGGIKLVSVTMF